jgi:alpha-glucosidase (family GH31 glycosyl hydrolase)
LSPREVCRRNQVSLYAKAGSIIRRQGETVVPSASHVSELILEVFPGSRGSCVLYEDDGKSQTYQRGRFVKSRFDLMGDGKQLTLYGHAAQGKSRANTRTIVIWAVLEKEPKSVLLGRKTLSRDALKYNPCTRRLIVNLPEMDSRKAFQLTLLV